MEEQKREKKTKIEYAKWIKSVRKKYKLTQSVFGEMVCHFCYEADKYSKESKKILVCKGYSQSSVKKWESGKNLPINIETLVSIAIIELTGGCERSEHLDGKTRRYRYKYVQRCIKEYFGRNLYCRNINDALFIAAIIGIYSVKEIPELYQKFAPIIQSVELSPQEKKEYSLEKQTDNMEEALLECEDEKDIENLVERCKICFYLGGRTVGERMMERYNTSEREIKGLKFREAVSVYSPRTAESYNRIFSSDSSISREWLLDLCIHLRFSRNEIELVLKDASMLALSKEKDDPESYLKSNNYYSIGSVKWYEKRAELENEGFQYRYSQFLSMPLKQKISYAVLLAYYSREKQMEEIPPVDYLLEYIPRSELFLELCEDIQESNVEDAVQKLDETLSELMVKINTPAGMEAYESYRREFIKYLQMREGKYRGSIGSLEGNKLTFIAGVTYSIFTGKIYRGVLLEKDFEQLKRTLKELPEQEKEAYYFMKLFWNMFLGNDSIYWKLKEGFYLAGNSKESSSNTLNLDEIIEDMEEICFMVSE